MKNTVTQSKKSRFTTRELALTAMMSVFIAVCSWISVPIGPVPFTMQTFAVFCTLSLLGGCKGFFSVVVYILMGAVGLPVFSGFKGGLSVLMGVTGGYISGFVLMALVYWSGEKISGGNFFVGIISMIFGILVLYTFGTFWFMKVYLSEIGSVRLSSAMGKCVLPFIVPDLIKMALAVVLTQRVKKYVRI